MSVLTNESIMQVRAWVVNAEQAAVNTWYYDISSVVGNPTSLEFLTALDTAIATAYKGLFGADCTYRGLQGRDIVQVPIYTDDVVTANSGVGTATGLTMPRQACGLTTWTTAFAGPKRRGRTYWPFPSVVDDAAGGVPSATYLTAMAGMATDLSNFFGFSSGGNSANTNFSVYSRKAPAGTTSITGFVNRTKFATMKKRGSYGRANSSPI